MTDDQESSELIARASSGDADALHYLLVMHQSRVRTVITEHLDGVAKWRIDPDDILQETYLAVFRSGSQPRFANFAQFSSWIQTIALNTTRNHLGATRRPRTAYHLVPDSRLASSSPHW